MFWNKKKPEVPEEEAPKGLRVVAVNWGYRLRDCKTTANVDVGLEEYHRHQANSQWLFKPISWVTQMDERGVLHQSTHNGHLVIKTEYGTFSPSDTEMKLSTETAEEVDL